MIELAVVVTRQRAFIFAGQALHIAQLAIFEAAGKNMKVSVIRRGNEYEALAIGRETRFDIYRAAMSELVGLLGAGVESPKFHSIVVILGVRNPSAVRRPVGLII